MNVNQQIAESSAHARRVSELDMDHQSYASDGDSADESRGKSGKGKSKEDKDKKGTGINRVSRACNHCRRMKMRCIGAEDPPCKRCKNSGLDCVMEKPKSTTGGGGEGDDRIRSLENQVSSLQSTLSELVSTLRQGMASPHSSSTTRISPQPPSDFMYGGGAVSNAHGQGQSLSQGMGGGIGASAGTLNQAQLGLMNSSPHNMNSIEMAFGAQGHGHGQAGSTGSGPTPPFFSNPTQAAQHHYLAQQQQQQQHHHPQNRQHQHNQQSPANHVRFSSQPDVHWHPMAHSDSTSPFGNLEGLMASGASATPGSVAGGISGSDGQRGGVDDWTQRLGAQSVDTLCSTQNSSNNHDHSHSHARNQSTDTTGERDAYQSIPPTRSGSLTPDDLLAPEDIINPLGAMSSMAGLVEAAVKASRSMKAGDVKREDGQGDGSGAGAGMGAAAGAGPRKRDADTSTGHVGAGEADDDTSAQSRGQGQGSGEAQNTGRPAKRSRHSPILPSGPVIHEQQHLPPQSSKERGKRERKKTHIHAYPDIVAEGLISEEEGKELMAIFYAGSSNFIPCFDPLIDTWESLRIRSPFSTTAILMAGARVRDGGGPISDVQRLAREHAQRIAVGTLFNPVARIEAVQAMILLAAFSENGWLPGGHAVRMAIDMGLNRSFLHLLRTGMGKGKSQDELEEERYLVVQSRIWFCLYLIEHQMAYGMGRPAILREDETIHQCRRLLEHPMSITSDARLVSTVELMALRAPLHIELTTSPDLPITENTMRRLRQANADFDAWERYWDRVLGDRFGKGRGDFFRESLIIQRQYAELFVNSQLLRGIKEPQDVINMPEEKRALAIRAMRNAQRCIEICLRGENYRNGLRYAVHYTHVCAAFAASFLIRIARLFPHELNLKKTAKDVDELANVLSEVPAGRYARSLRLILRRARKAKVIPAPSRPVSPNRGAASLPSLSPFASNSLTMNSTNKQQQPAQSPFSPSQLINPEYLKTPTPGPSGSASMGMGMMHPAQGQGQAQGQSMGFSPSNAAYMGQNHNQNQNLADIASAFTPNTAALFNAAGQIVDDSPSSGGGADLFEFDQLFAVETMERAGMTQDGDQLPLFLDGHSLGGQGTDSAPFGGMEQFFLPPALDNRLGGPDAAEQNGSAMSIFDPNLLAEEIWW